MIFDTEVLFEKQFLTCKINLPADKGNIIALSITTKYLLRVLSFN